LENKTLSTVTQQHQQGQNSTKKQKSEFGDYNRQCDSTTVLATKTSTATKSRIRLRRQCERAITVA